ncbi:hypothetical protein [Nocardia amamiensis]|uniref:hypothetical protein n=1 Tax=Nocardia amamiensis TaxID=404578 RepID=UPI0012F4E0C7|nr:hypothetical protein [Nocardia amamiensis]
MAGEHGVPVLAVRSKAAARLPELDDQSPQEPGISYAGLSGSEESLPGNESRADSAAHG